MSLKTMLWALNDAPVDDPTEVLVLIALADRAGDDGEDAYPSREWIANRARTSVRTVQRRLNRLEEAGIIKRGDQSRISDKIPADRRPVVWDLNINLVRGDSLAHRDGVTAGVERGVMRGRTGCHAGSNGVTAGVERGDTVGTQTVLNRPEPSLTVLNQEIGEPDGSAPKETPSLSELASVASLPESKPVSVPPPAAAPLPDDWVPTAKHREKAAALGVDLERTVDEMRRWAFAKDVKRKRWNQQFDGFLARAKPTKPVSLPKPPVDLDAAFAAADVKAIRAVTGVLVYEPTEFVTGDVRDRKRLFTEWLLEHRERIVAAGEKGEKVYQG